MDKRALAWVLGVWLLVAAFIGLVWADLALCWYFDNAIPALIPSIAGFVFLISRLVYLQAMEHFAKEDRIKLKKGAKK